jgi:pantoate--beta-alanine ligase
MEVCRTVKELRAWRASRAGTLGFVPTMGALHAGHRALLDRMRAECDHAVCSIYVNPTQFGANEDLSRYPRPFAADLVECEAAGVDCVLAVPDGEMYRDLPLAVVEVMVLSGLLEGESRPGHFRGVATVVAKLFNIVQPQRAYFGEKDYQQLCVIRALVADLHFPVQLIPCPTVREADGLALSSRNAYLWPAERAAAPRLYEALLAVRHTYLAGERNPQQLAGAGATLLRIGKLALDLDYLAVTEGDHLRTPPTAHDNCRVLIAARFQRPPAGSATRLIDNIPLVDPAAADRPASATPGSKR